MRQSIEIRCPNLPYDKSRDDTNVDHQEIVCGAFLGGVPQALVEDTRDLKLFYYCSGCKMLWEVCFDGHNAVPSFKYITDKIAFLKLEAEHGLVSVEGRKTKNRKR